MRIFKNILIGLVLLIGLVFAFFNAESVTVDYLFGELETPLVIVLLLDFVFGFAVAFLLFYGRILKQRADLAKQRRRLRDADDEIRNLRNLPIREG